MKPIDACQSNGVRYFIVADDLTGACDSAVAFAGRGLEVEVPLRSDGNPSSSGVFAVSTESRDIPEVTAMERVRTALSKAPAASEIFKKIDSVFRGNTFAEVRAAAEFFPAELVVMSPAYPALGRTVKDGVLHVEGGAQKHAVNLWEGLRRSGIGDPVLLPDGVPQEKLVAGMREAMKAKSRLVLCDAEKEQDLQSAARAARSLGCRVLWVGSGGLAHALAHDLPQSGERWMEEERDGCVVFFIGSDHAVTKKQVAALKQAAEVGEFAVEACTSRTFQEHVLVLKVSRGITTEQQIQQALSSTGDKGIRCCLLTGGDTAALVLRASGVRSLHLTGEFAPGLPYGVANGGVLDGVPVILKSGGFGREDVLCQIVDRFTGRREFV
ncbi:four-carbon acid sugar kinase family protein [Edaphobacter sp. 12200R-103]|uniref:four-carbon acid sugar kinase family protein n=1 Tax=Edaphobacter sp. 12200R-103 TaxID=2703788 RepID=UPI00138CFECD|nr:four-carbon acid sugar kinase family protein [Edaphobacter sp. 12200R-103]QHS51632.1 four-carbon acid sugar kinase family protein [Edaphobacter sp. 12200R-103]